MSELHFPWLEAGVLLPLIGLLSLIGCRDSEQVRRRTILTLSITLLTTLGAAIDFFQNGSRAAHDHWDALRQLAGRDVLMIDALSAPLLPLTAMLSLVTALSTPSTKRRRFPFGWNLVSTSLLLATFSSRAPGDVVLLTTLGMLPPLMELVGRKRPVRVFCLHMGLCAALLVSGWWLSQSVSPTAAVWGAGLLLAGVLVRSGVVPVHCWLTDLFEHATFGSALLFATPMVGAYAAVRLVLPIAPDWMIRSLALASLATSVYAAAMALVQTEARRFFCYVFLSHSALVLVGLETATPISLTGSLAVWLSSALALTGFGLTLRSMEARIGRISLANYHGMYEHTPTLAIFFLLTGLASVGFPGAFGFIGAELLVEGAVAAYPGVGTAVVLAAALNGIAVLQAYFRVFTGVRHASAIPLRIGAPERASALVLTALIAIGGLIPQPYISSRYQAALEIHESRALRGAASPPVVRRAQTASPSPSLTEVPPRAARSQDALHVRTDH
ncbi:MAG: oxidoreductase [Planctomyces sp.]|nr:oxidoreductase [Planctomyces sp.]